MKILPRAIGVIGLICATFIVTAIAVTVQSPEPTVVLVDGGKYFGPLKDGKLHGKGRLVWPGGRTYEGEFVDGQMSGRGVERDANGYVYEGEFVNGRAHGSGKSSDAVGLSHVGQYRHGLYHGQGRLNFSNGDLYVGEFRQGYLDGYGTLTSAKGDRTYKGEFKLGQFSGGGEETVKDGMTYKGQFAADRYHGKGRHQSAEGDVYEGEFEHGELTGKGTYTWKNGAKSVGKFIKGRIDGHGYYVDQDGSRYEGTFLEGEFTGDGTLTGKNGLRYRGNFSNWRFHGSGELHMANGDTYRGQFEYGVFHGEGTLTRADPREGQAREEKGNWQHGKLGADDSEDKALVAVETALYGERKLLDEALQRLAPREADKVNLYLLAIAGDGSQEVFRREVEYVRDAFAARFQSATRTVVLANSRTSIGRLPMATRTSVSESLDAIGLKMDKEKDILFLFLTSHGAKDHTFALTQNQMGLRDLTPAVLASALKESGIRWKVLVVSACYAGGFIAPLKDENTLIITAARHDRQSFGCEDTNDFTYFGRAYFRDALPKSKSFQEAFTTANALVTAWEEKDKAKSAKPGDFQFSLPQIESGKAIAPVLERFWAERR